MEILFFSFRNIHWGKQDERSDVQNYLQNSGQHIFISWLPWKFLQWCCRYALCTCVYYMFNHFYTMFNHFNRLIISNRIQNYPSHSLSSLNTGLTHDEVDSIIAEAFRVWSDVSPLQFHKSDANDADIVLLFGARSHTKVRFDPVFDGEGGTLAHAFTPNSGWGDTNGDVHFDDDETFTHLVYSGKISPLVCYSLLRNLWINGDIHDYIIKGNNRRQTNHMKQGMPLLQIHSFALIWYSLFTNFWFLHD